MQRTERFGRRLSSGLPAGTHAAALLALGLATGGAQAQESNFGVTFGTKVWVAEWSTWFISETAAGNEFITQNSAKTKAILIPQLSFRYRDFIASVSGAVNSTHEFEQVGAPPAEFKRREVDTNFGYTVTPGLALSVGFKQFDQINSSGQSIYKVSGPTIGVSAASPLSSGFSVYGALGIGLLKVRSVAADVSADYSLNEVGLAYSLPLGRFIKSINLSAGYRMQVIKARGLVLGNSITPTTSTAKQDARDTTQGFTLAAVAAF